ncbi:MAG TPA: SDR family NAD(P)-dependent oxidoreductase [Caldilineaceae bacterium]|nr:SDR family NAD(P)-dependent oxidoreductase [Caldilineaceae bacterium]
MQLAGKVAFVTGAGSGIGKAAALTFAQEGAKVAVLGRTESQLNKTVEEIKGAGGEALAVLGDVSQPNDVEQAIQRVLDAWGRLDIVLANAGINGVWASLEELTPDDWDKTLNINLKGTFLTVKYAVPHLKKQGGAIVVVSSVNGTRMFSNTGATAYACSKAAQLAFTKMTALELAPHKVRINCICPGWIATEIGDNTDRRPIDRWPVEYPKGAVPLTHGKPGSAEQVAQLILFLVSDASSHITGTEMWIDGGQSLLQG